MKILALETTCDETAAAVLEGGRLLSNVVFSQIPLHRRYNGVVPELASRAHLEKIAFVLDKALACTEAGAGKGRAGRPQAASRKPDLLPASDLRPGSSKLPAHAVDAVAFSRGPGLPGGLMVGRVAAQAAAGLLGARLIGVNHLEGHLLACEYEGRFVTRKLEFPLAALLVSGGHTELWHARGYGRYKVLGRTRDDAAGEAFDKVAKLLGLPYPGGPAVERAAAAVKKTALKFPRPHLEGSWDFSFSGLKTAVSYYLAGRLGNDFYRFSRRLSPAGAAEVCRAFQDAVIETLVRKTALAAAALGVKNIVVGGGVSANRALRKAFSELEEFNVRFAQPPYCSDNAAMIALCAMKRLESAAAGQRRGTAGSGAIDISPDLASAAWR